MVGVAAGVMLLVTFLISLPARIPPGLNNYWAGLLPAHRPGLGPELALPARSAARSMASYLGMGPLVVVALLVPGRRGHARSDCDGGRRWRSSCRRCSVEMIVLGSGQAVSAVRPADIPLPDHRAGGDRGDRVAGGWQPARPGALRVASAVAVLAVALFVVNLKRAEPALRSSTRVPGRGPAHTRPTTSPPIDGPATSSWST